MNQTFYQTAQARLPKPRITLTTAKYEQKIAHITIKLRFPLPTDLHVSSKMAAQ
jgi:hypothetical protein